MSHDTEDYQNGINGSRRNPLSVQDRRILEEMAGGNYFEYLMKGEYQSFVFRLRRVRYWIVKVIIYDYKIDNQLESEVINMAMYDWNGDGKKNSVDNFIEYQVYKDCTNKKSSSGVSSDWWVMPVLAIIAGVCPIVGVIIFLGVLLFD